MNLRKGDFFVDCVGAVTILTVDRIIFQGQIKRDDDRHHEDTPPEINIYVENEIEFILLELRCEPALISDNANRDDRDHAHIEKIRPSLFDEGDIVRINLAEIVAVGPSNGCLFGDDKGKGN